jgi:hypothetical protein
MPLAILSSRKSRRERAIAQGRYRRNPINLNSAVVCAQDAQKDAETYLERRTLATTVDRSFARPRKVVS